MAVFKRKGNDWWMLNIKYGLTSRTFWEFLFWNECFTWAKMWKAAVFLFHRKNCCLTMWKYYLLCHIVKHIFFLFCKKWSEASFLLIYPAFVIPQGKDWRFSNILKKVCQYKCNHFLQRPVRKTTFSASKKDKQSWMSNSLRGNSKKSARNESIPAEMVDR